jgi:hypothetical protein
LRHKRETNNNAALIRWFRRPAAAVHHELGARRLGTPRARGVCALHRRNSAAPGPFTAMIAIALTPEAYEAIKASLSELDNPASPGPDGLIRVWLDRATLDRLGRLSEPGEGYSDVILRLAKAG